MLTAADFQLGCVFIEPFGEQVIIDEDRIEVLMGARNYEDWQPVAITREILRDNLGFEISDLGDYWEAQLGDFVLHQPKMDLIPGMEMGFMFGYKTTVSKTIVFEHVHHLQNIYRTLQEKVLVWKQQKTT